MLQEENRQVLHLLVFKQPKNEQPTDQTLASVTGLEEKPSVCTDQDGHQHCAVDNQSTAAAARLHKSMDP